MWHTRSTDSFHNMFGLPIMNPPKKNERIPHDPYILFKSTDFDMIHYNTTDTIKLVENNNQKVERILKDLGYKGLTPLTILELGPIEIESFLIRYFNKEIKLQGVERAYDRLLDIPYHIFYYVELLDDPDNHLV